MRAATLALANCIPRYQWRNTVIHLGIDNSAVAFALRHMYSSSSIATQDRRRILEILKENNSVLDIVLLVSEDNPADDPSRGETVLSEERLRRGWQAMMRSIQGSPLRSIIHTNDAHGVRHPLDGGLLKDEVEDH